ncbi:MAG: nuclear transport factor 2 family protein [Deltaproteobacteria bacterium]|nr:nuclear transport factor 2 family protein [Deltaproteobacteria bacterium]
MMMKYLLLAVIFSVLFLFSGFADAGEKPGAAMSADETEISGIVRAYEKTWNNVDVEPYLALWHDDAKLTHGAFYTKDSKDVYRGKAKGLMEGFPNTKIYDEKISVNGDKATVKAIQDIGGFSYNITWDMVKEKGKWFIMGNMY